MKDLDKKILIQLIKNAEQPIVDIADKVGATRQTVSKKVSQFKSSGIIEGFKVKIRPEKIGLDVRAYVFLQESPQDDVRAKIEDEINSLTQVTKFFRVFGRYSGILEVWAENKEELTSLVKKIHRFEGVKETETFIVHNIVKSNTDDPLLEMLRNE